MIKIDNFLEEVKSVGITGHIRPDGDCAGSCMALYNYIVFNYPEIEVDVYLESHSEKFDYLMNSDKVIFGYGEDKTYDLFVVLDTGDLPRVGDAVKYFNNAKNTLNIDHHISNNFFAKENIVIVDASSASEVLFKVMDEKKINKEIAECIYTGIIHDSGVFKHSNTSEETMRIAGKLMSYGIEFGKIIDSSFYSRTYNQALILGRALLEIKMSLDDKCVSTYLTKEDMDEFSVTSKDLDGVVDQLRVISNVECAIFLYEIDDSNYKVSLRSNDYLDVNQVAKVFGGGGHLRAAGCSIAGPIDETIENLLVEIKKQIR